MFGIPQEEQCSLHLHLHVNPPENISIHAGPGSSSLWLTIAEPQELVLLPLSAVGPSSQRLISLLFLIKCEFGAKLHPTVYLRKIKCQKSCSGPVRSVQKSWAQRAFCILFFLSVRVLLISANRRGFAVSSLLCLWYAETPFLGTAAGSTPLSCSTHFGLSDIRLSYLMPPSSYKTCAGKRAMPHTASSVRGDRRCSDSSFSVCLCVRWQCRLLSGLLTPRYCDSLAPSPFMTGRPDG